MIPILYDEKAENIICSLNDTIKCVAHEVQNSVFELDLEYSIYSDNFNEIELNKVIKAKASDELGEQFFRIYYISNDLNGFIEVKAQHISYDLIDNFVENITCTNSTCEASFNAMLNKCQTPHKFIGYSDITHTSTYNLSRVNGFEAILGTRGSLLDTYGNGAKLKRDNYNLYLNKNRGANNGVKIAYAKNITGYKRELDESELVTCIYPFAKIQNEVEEGEGIEETLVLPERFIQSENINKYPHPKILAVDFSDDSVKSIEDLRKASSKYFSETKKDVPKVNYEVEFIYLYQTSQYSDLNLKDLELVGMGDTVTIEDKRIGMNVEAEVIENYYNSLTERYEKIILGNFKSSLSDIFNDDINTSIEDGLDNVRKDIYTNFEVLEDKIISEVSSLEGDVKANTTLIQQTSNSISSMAKDISNNTTLLNQTASNISSKVSKGEVVSSINQSAENIKINANKIQLEGTTTVGNGESYISINNYDYRAYVNCQLAINVGGYNDGGSFLPSLYMGANGFNSASSGSDGQYFVMKNYGSYHHLAQRHQNGTWSTISFDSNGNITYSPVGNSVFNSNVNFTKATNYENSLNVNKGSAIYLNNTSNSTKAKLTYDKLAINKIGTYDATNLTTDSTIAPTTNNTVSIGTSSYKFKNLYGYNMYTDNIDLRYISSPVSTLYIDQPQWGLFCPNKNEYQYLGSDSSRWRTIYLYMSPNITSDARKKENIRYVNSEDYTTREDIITQANMYDFVKDELNIAEYNYLEEKKNTFGFIAQDLEQTKVGSSILTKDSEGFLAYDSGAYVNILAGALKEAISKIEKLESEIKILKANN